MSKQTVKINLPPECVSVRTITSTCKEEFDNKCTGILRSGGVENSNLLIQLAEWDDKGKPIYQYFRQFIVIDHEQISKIDGAGIQLQEDDRPVAVTPHRVSDPHQ